MTKSQALKSFINFPAHFLPVARIVDGGND